jgi:asparagine synthetase B (glutamine-hydrolysing)
VVLSGEGADEILGGYGIYSKMHGARPYQQPRSRIGRLARSRRGKNCAAMCGCAASRSKNGIAGVPRV